MAPQEMQVAVTPVDGTSLIGKSLSGAQILANWKLKAGEQDSIEYVVMNG